MQITQREVRGVIILDLEGRLVLEDGVTPFVELMNTLGHRGGTRILLNFAKVTYLDSAGLALLLRLAERMQARQQMLSVVVPVDSRVRRAFELTGLLSVIDVVSRSEDALSETRPGSANDQV